MQMDVSDNSSKVFAPFPTVQILAARKVKRKLSEFLEKSACSLTLKQSIRIQINSATRGGGARCSPARVRITRSAQLLK